MKTFACGLFSNTVDCQIYYFFASIQSFKLHLTAGIIKLFLLLLLPSEILGLKYATKFLLVFCFLSNEAHYGCNRTRAPYVIKKNRSYQVVCRETQGRRRMLESKVLMTYIINY